LPPARPEAGPAPIVPAGWHHHLCAGRVAPIEEALTSIMEHVRAVYRLKPDQTFDRWLPDRPELSTIETVQPYEPLFTLMAAPAKWNQEPAAMPPAAVDLVPGCRGHYADHRWRGRHSICPWDGPDLGKVHTAETRAEHPQSPRSLRLPNRPGNGQPGHEVGLRCVGAPGLAVPPLISDDSEGLRLVAKGACACSW
jgi:hypothetical protein